MVASQLVQLAILGAGRIGTVHGLNICKLPNARIKYIYDESDEAADRLAEQCNSSVAQLEDILNDEVIDGVLICTDTASHLALAELFVRKNVPVFCEKPIDLSLESADQFLRFCEEKKGIVQIGFQKRFDADFIQAYKSVKEGEIGNIEILSITSRDPRPADERYIKESPSIFLDMMIHDFDLARWFIPEKIIEVFASGDCLNKRIYSKYDDIDTAVVLLKTENNKFIIIQNSRSTDYGYDQRLEAKGAQGLITLDNQPENLVTISNSKGIRSAVYLDNFLERYNSAYRSEIIHFIDVITNRINPRATVIDGYESLRLALLAEKSFKERRNIFVSI